MSLTRQLCCILILAVLCLEHVQGIAVGAKNEAKAAPARGADTALMLPEISHYKTPGGDYKQASPLFQRQEAWKTIGLIEHPTPPKTINDLPVSNTMRCVVIMSTLFFFTFSALFVVQTLYRLGVKSLKNQEAALTAAAQSLFFTPMLAVLFLATRMRAVQLARGQEPTAFNLPQKWVRQAESASTAALVVIAVTTLIAASLNGSDWENAAKRARSDNGNLILSTLLQVRRGVTLFLYVAFTVVCYGAYTMEPPEELWSPDEVGPEVSPALQCTIFLSMVYFIVYLGLACAKMFNEFGVFGPPLRFSAGQTIFKHAATTVALVPMLTSLFIAVRMRALQLDPVSGNPAGWIQVCFYCCSGSIALLVVLAVVGGVQERDTSLTPNITIGASCWQTFTEIARVMLMSGLYTWTLAILYGLFGMEASHTDPLYESKKNIPASVYCVSVLCMLYFTIYMMLWVHMTFLDGAKNGDKAAEQPAVGGLGIQAAREAVGFCPMLCVIFLGVMLRAMQVSHGYGAPPDICQKAMYAGTIATVVLTLSRFFMSWEYAPQSIFVVLQYLSLMTMYASISFVILCLVNMTPKTAHGAGSIVPKTQATVHDQMGDGVDISDMMGGYF